jgi:NAD(P)-dependent dehydrogenase (short-subunit alcohol dehydrogenase family)
MWRARRKQLRNGNDSDHSLRGLVVLITGASSGIGRATSIAFARRGSHVVVAARRAKALDDVVRDCVGWGGQALAVPTDITVPEQVDELVRAAIDRFGRIDVWINNAAVLMLGRLDVVPMDAFRRVMATNFFARVYCTRAALRHFRARKEGVIIDVNSVLGRLAQPYASSYVASKFAGRGLSESLREELLDTPGIRVCSVFPAPVDTPIYSHAANFTARQIRPIWPLYRAMTVAEQIVALVRSPEREVFAGRIGPLMSLVHALMPTLTERLVRSAIDRVQVSRDRRVPTLGNLMHPSSEPAAVSGGWHPHGNASQKWVAVAAILGLSVGLATAIGSGKMKSPKRLRRRYRASFPRGLATRKPQMSITGAREHDSIHG